MTRGGGASASLRYDPLGRLYEVTGSSGTRRFLYDGDDLVAEYNTSGTLLRRYVHGLGAGDDPQVWFEGSTVADSARRYLYTDERGSVTAVTDSVGNVLHVNTYDEYGIPDAANLGAFGYTGQVWLPELGMNYYKARMYSPTLRRSPRRLRRGCVPGDRWRRPNGLPSRRRRLPAGSRLPEGGRSRRPR